MQEVNNQLEQYDIQAGGIEGLFTAGATGIGIGEIKRRYALQGEVERQRHVIQTKILDDLRKSADINETDYLVRKHQYELDAANAQLSLGINQALEEFKYNADRLRQTTEAAREVLVGTLTDYEAIRDNLFGEKGTKTLVLKDMFEGLFDIRSQNLTRDLIEQLFPGDLLGKILGGKYEELSPEAQAHINALSSNTMALNANTSALGGRPAGGGGAIGVNAAARSSKWQALAGVLGMLGGTMAGGAVAKGQGRTGEFVGMGTGLLSTLGSVALGPYGALLGIAGGVLGGLLSPKIPDTLTEIEEAVERVVENTNVLRDIDARIINAPADFTLPPLATAGGNRIDQVTIHVGGSGDPGAVADAVISKLNRSFDVGSSSYEVVGGGV
jgi:hypothetical protein